MLTPTTVPLLPEAFAVRAELGVPGDVDTLFAALEACLVARTGQARLDILVNNTGGRGEDITPEAFDRLVAINTKAPLFITQRALPLLNDNGRIIKVAFLSSEAGGWVTGQVIDASGGCFLGPRI